MWILGLKGLKRVAVDTKGKGLQDSRTWTSTTRARARLTSSFLHVYSKKQTPRKTLFYFFFFLSTKKVNTELRLHKFSLITFFCPYRVWYRDTGHFIGFFSQPRLWHLPSAKSVPSTPVRPYDISEVSRHNQQQQGKRR